MRFIVRYILKGPDRSPPDAPHRLVETSLLAFFVFVVSVVIGAWLGHHSP